MNTPELDISAEAIEPAARAAFPFTALVGQPQLQRALQLAATSSKASTNASGSNLTSST